MVHANSYVAFHDLSPKGRFLWLSPSVIDVLGYTPEELVGTCSYDIILEQDRHLTQSIHKEVLMSDLVAGQVTYRVRTKDGTIATVNLILNLCYDIGITCGTLLDAYSSDYVQLGAQTAAMTRKTGSKKEIFERVKRHHKAFEANSHLWDSQAFVPEPRVCMILNRYSRSLIVMYASPACEIIFNIEPEQIEGKPILLFVRADELGSFVENVDSSKSSGAIMNIRFWFQSPNLSYEVPCEAVLFGCSDGVVAIMRQCKPFVRRHLIGCQGHYSTSNSSSWHGSSPSYNSESTSTSPGSTQSSSLPRVTRSQLQAIKIMDRNDGNVRVLGEVTEVDPLEQDIDLVTKKLGIREFSIQDYVEDEDDDDGDIEVLGE
ncbi:hypothetical protein BGX27_011276 [Mortierella sp. AM989]|nr:hypothetical protein BGX27_011276 [Mortierella sp. AM989]